MAYDSKVIIKILGDATNFNNVINGAQTSIKSLQSLLAKLGLSVGVGTAIKEAISNTNALEDSLAQASTLFGDVNVDVDNLNKKLIEMSNATGISADSIGTSLYNALSSGVKVTEDMGTAMDFMDKTTKLAVAGFTSVEQAVDSVAKIQNAYGEDVLSVDQISKNLIMTQNLGITTVDQLSTALATVTPIASAFGVSFEEVGASLSVMTKAGTDTATATTQLRSLISSLAQSDTQASNALKKASEQAKGQAMSFEELQEKGYTLQDMLKMMESYAESTGVSLVDLFGEIRAGTGALQLASDTTGTYNTYLEEMAKDADIVTDAYNKVMGTRSKQWKLLATQLKNITVKITQSEGSQKLLDDLSKTAQTMLDNIEAWLPDMLNSLNSFYLQAKLVFSYLQGEYDRSFLKTGVEFVLSVVSDEWDELKTSFESGDIFGTALKLVGDIITIKVGFELVQELGKLVSSDFATAFGSKSGALMLVGDILMVYYGFKQAQEKGDWETFGAKLVTAIVAGATVAGLTGNLTAGLLVFGMAFNLVDNGFKDQVKNLLEEIAEDFTEFSLEAMNTYAESLDAWNAMFGKETHYGDQIVTPKEAKAIEEEKKRLEEQQQANEKEKQELEASIASKQKAIEDVLTYLEKIGVITDKTIKNDDLEMITNMAQRVSNGASLSSAYQDYIKAEEIYLQQVGNDMTTTAESALTAVRNELMSLWDTEVGRNAILGIYGGFSKEELANIGIEAGKNLLDAVKDELGIHSPSEEFKKIGDFCIQGLAEGMTKTEATEKLNSAFDTIYDNMRQAVKDGEMSLEEAFAELKKMLSLSSSYISQISAYTTSASSSQTAHRTTGGGGINSIEGWTLNENGKWIEQTKSGWQKMLDWLKNACSDVGNWLFGDLGLKDADGNPLKDEEGNLVEFGKTGQDLLNAFADSFSEFNTTISEGISSSYDNQITALEEARDKLKENNELSIEEEEEYDAKISDIKKQQFEKQKKLNIANAVMSGAQAILSIWSEWSKLPLVASALTAVAVATTAKQISTISSQSSGYESGGLIGGHGYTGDKQQIWANAGELILNRAQQRAIADQLNYGGNSTVVQVNFGGNVFGDKQTIAEYVYDAIKTAQSTGAVQAW